MKSPVNSRTLISSFFFSPLFANEGYLQGIRYSLI